MVRAARLRAVRRGVEAIFSAPPATRCLGGRDVVDDLAEHQLDDPFLRSRRHVDDTDGRALAQDGRAVAHGRDLDHPMRDEDHRPVAMALPSDDLEDPLGEVGRQGRGHLVEHQHGGLDGQRASEVDDAQRRQRYMARQIRQVEVRQSQLTEPVAERLDRGVGQAQVGADVQVRDEGRFLVDGDDAAAARLRRRACHPRLAADRDGAAVRLDGGGEDLDQRALAGAVGAHQRVDLARTNRERRVAQRDHSPVGLGDPGRFEQQVGRDGHRSSGCGEGTPAVPASPRGTTIRVRLGYASPGPLQATACSGVYVV